MIEITSDQVTQPAHARYAWKNYPEEVALRSTTSLPASPFTTEPWWEETNE